MGWNWSLGSMPYGDRWRTRRKMFTHYLHPNNSQLINPIVLEFVQNMLRQLRESPDDFLTITEQ